MLTREDNELLCRVGPGTPMGNLLRYYWHPLLYSWELEADGAPLRVRLLGEDLVAFRDSNGSVAFVQNNCPHRGASLFFGRNEEAGLRCVYHGWKFDVAGNCVDMPNEPAESNFKHKIKLTAYPGREAGGVIWAYMGPQPAPELPHLEWALMPENQRRVNWKAVRECNWFQALEGDMDSSHIGFLHSRLDVNNRQAMGGFYNDKAPVLEVIETDYGAMYGARRQERPDAYYWRVSQFMMPYHGIFPAAEDGKVPCHIWVPIDDYNTLSWGLDWHPLRPFTAEELDPSIVVSGGGAEYLPATSRPHGRWYTVANLSTDYLIDREIQRTQTYTGIPTVALQDTAVTETMGAICDRTKEHLGTSDTMIIVMRRHLLKAARALRDHGTLPPEVLDPTMFRRRSSSITLPKDVIWTEALKDWHEARGGLPAIKV